MRGRNVISIGPVSSKMSSDPRYAMAQQLSGGNNVQITDPWSGLNSAISKMLGANQTKNLQNEYADRDAAYNQSMTQAMAAMLGSPSETKQYKDGTTINWDERKPDVNMAANMLMGNPDTQSMGQEFALQGYQDQKDAESQAAQYAREDAKWERDAALKRELAKMKNQGSSPYVDPETGEIVTPQRKLSATEQKEFYEADDRILAGENAMEGLKNALSKNDEAYSGTLADERAWLSSNLGNLFGYETPRADATVSLKNSTTAQALESLKTIFGGMPTEGERKVLLELQASVDKTPEQRKEILNRAMGLAKRRLDRDRLIQQGLSTGNIYQTTPAQTAAQEKPDERAFLRGKGMTDAQIDAFLQSRGR